MNKDLVYICSPLSADSSEGIKENMQKAKEYMEIVSKIFNCRAVAPHAFLPDFLDDNIPQERQLGIKFGIDFLKMCKKLIVCGDIISKGMACEIAYAKKLGIDILSLKKVNAPKVKITVIEIEGEQQ